MRIGLLSLFGIVVLRVDQGYVLMTAREAPSQLWYKTHPGLPRMRGDEENARCSCLNLVSVALRWFLLLL